MSDHGQHRLVVPTGAGPPFTAALDAGVPLREVHEAAMHADQRTTMRYERAQVSLDRHNTNIVAAFLSGVTR
ncbi:MAG: hypothetical protein LC792_24205 [Actinobacteria bacterium]|nr:hypothetical protein [Actinomycetota bacterium]